jgi:hypothetical protein
MKPNKESEVTRVAQAEVAEPGQPPTEPDVLAFKAIDPGQPAEPAQPVTESGIPTFTLHASDPAELRGFIQIVQNARALGFSRAQVQKMEGILRHFEFHDERTRKHR